MEYDAGDVAWQKKEVTWQNGADVCGTWRGRDTIKVRWHGWRWRWVGCAVNILSTYIESDVASWNTMFNFYLIHLFLDNWFFVPKLVIIYHMYRYKVVVKYVVVTNITYTCWYRLGKDMVTKIWRVRRMHGNLVTFIGGNQVLGVRKTKGLRFKKLPSSLVSILPSKLVLACCWFSSVGFSSDWNAVQLDVSSVIYVLR